MLSVKTTTTTRGLTHRELLASLLDDHGVCSAIVVEHLATGGKELRAKLALAACEAMGVDPAQAVGLAAACEAIHNASLIHDDLQDGDTERRGEPTVWVRHGAAQAINAGDLLLMLPFQAVSAIPATEAVRFRLCRVFADYAAATVRGQAEELDLLASGRVDADSYAWAVRGKTSALFELPIVGAALLAGLGPLEASEVARPFGEIGVVYQMADDLVDLYGDKGRSLRGGDLAEGKVSALVVEHIALHPESRSELLGVLRAPREQTAQQTIDTWIQRFLDSGAAARVLARLDRDASDAIEALRTAHPSLVPIAMMLLSRVLRPLDALRIRVGAADAA